LRDTRPNELINRYRKGWEDHVDRMDEDRWPKMAWYCKSAENKVDAENRVLRPVEATRFLIYEDERKYW
jgi:hypothetical protein